MMKKWLFSVFSVMTALLLGAADASYGFVYRGRMRGLNGELPGKNESYDVKFRLYERIGDTQPLWEGETTIHPETNGLFQTWVSDAIRTGSVPLVDAFASARAAYLGVAYDGGHESVPRQLVTAVPAVGEARETLSLAQGGTISALTVTGRIDVETFKAKSWLSADVLKSTNLVSGINRFYILGGDPKTGIRIKAKHVKALGSPVEVKVDSNPGGFYWVTHGENDLTTYWCSPRIGPEDGGLVVLRMALDCYGSNEAPPSFRVPCVTLPVNNGKFTWHGDIFRAYATFYPWRTEEK